MPKRMRVCVYVCFCSQLIGVGGTGHFKIAADSLLSHRCSEAAPTPKRMRESVYVCFCSQLSHLISQPPQHTPVPCATQHKVVQARGGGHRSFQNCC